MRNISRKAFITTPVVLVGTIISATACNSRTNRSSSISTTSVSMSPQTLGPNGGVILKSSWKGTPLEVEVGPAVVKNDHTVVRLSVLVSSDAQDPSETLSLSQVFSKLGEPYTMLGIQMLDLENGLVYRQLSEVRIDASNSINKKNPVEIFPVFSAPDNDLQVVQVFLPSMGIVSVPVANESVVRYSVDKVLSDVEVSDKGSGKFKLESLIQTADGSADTKENEESTTVTLAGDVTFAVDSDQLSAQADAVLAGVVEQIRNYPSGGDLTITGHTDDVADDAHNQDLSERRAKAVSDQLSKLTNLLKWNKTVLGKGELSPRVPNDSEENRKINRRVEVILKPSKPEERDSTGSTVSPSSTTLPETPSPVGKGADGVKVSLEGGEVHISMDRVVRIGKFLSGTLMLKVDRKVDLPAWAFSMPNTIQDKYWPGIVHHVCSLTILHEGSQYLEATFFDSDGHAFPVSNNFVYPLESGAPMRLPALWPDTGSDSVVLDVPAGHNTVAPNRISFRLTDIPVADS